MANVLVIFRREFQGYFSTPIAYVFMGVFVALAGVFSMYIGGFFIRAQGPTSPRSSASIPGCTCS